MTTSLPKLADDNARPLMAAIRSHLDSRGLTRDPENRLNGAECTGWTDAFGSTGFSVRGKSTLMVGHDKYDDNILVFHVVMSGNLVGIRYRRIPIDTGDETPDWGHEPINEEAPCPRIKAAFEELGFEVLGVQHAGHQTLWDDDISYNVIVRRPSDLGPDPVEPGRRW